MKVKEIVWAILDYISENSTKKISIEEISSVLGYSRFYIMKKFKEEIGVSIISYINILKILNSLNDLNSNKSMLKVALDNGFNSLEYYSEMFKKFIGVSPVNFKKILHNPHINYNENILNNILTLKSLRLQSTIYWEKYRKNIYPVMKLKIAKDINYSK